jgi:threonine/homoserine/homoserine lactone efflux protein
MTTTTYFLYLAAVAVLVASPGPTMLMALSNALTHGASRGIVSAAGSVGAVLVIMLLSALGLGAVLAASELAFTGLKIVGAAYLIYLGVKTWRSPAMDWTISAQGQKAARPALHTSFMQGVMVGASNPKALLFFSAFFPQFINPNAAWAPQFGLLAITFVAFELSLLNALSLGAARVKPWLAVKTRMLWLNRICGGLFASMGAALLLVRRQS